MNLERTCVLLFYYFLCLKVNLDLEKANQLGESSPNFIFAVVNLDPIILGKGWIDGESWPNDFVGKVNRGEDLRWVGSRCPLTRALAHWMLSPDLHATLMEHLHLTVCVMAQRYLRCLRWTSSSIWSSREMTLIPSHYWDVAVGWCTRR